MASSVERTTEQLESGDEVVISVNRGAHGVRFRVSEARFELQIWS